MKKYVLILLLISASLGSFAQGNSNEDYERYRKVYKYAMKYNDFPVAKHALYNMLAANPESDSALYALALYYRDAQDYASCLLVCLDINQRNPNDLLVAEAMAFSYENLGLKSEALDTYEKIFLLSDDINALYKVAFMQFDLKRYEECTTNIDILLSRKEIDEEILVFSFEKDKQEEFAMRIPVLNLKGALLRVQGDNDGARKVFEEVLSLAPNFKIARDNLARLN